MNDRHAPGLGDELHALARDAGSSPSLLDDAQFTAAALRRARAARRRHSVHRASVAVGCLAILGVAGALVMTNLPSPGDPVDGATAGPAPAPTAPPLPDCAVPFDPPQSSTSSVELVSEAHRDAQGQSLPSSTTARTAFAGGALVPLELRSLASSWIDGGVAPRATVWVVKDGLLLATADPVNTPREKFEIVSWELSAPVGSGPVTTCDGTALPEGDYDIYASVTLQVTSEGIDDSTAAGGPWRVHVTDAAPAVVANPAELLACGASTADVTATRKPFRAELMQNRNIDPGPGSDPAPQIILQDPTDRGAFSDFTFLQDLKFVSGVAAVLVDDVVVANAVAGKNKPPRSEGFAMIGKVDFPFPATGCDGADLPDGPVDIVTAIELERVSTGEHLVVVSNHWQSTIPLY